MESKSAVEPDSTCGGKLTIEDGDRGSSEGGRDLSSLETDAPAETTEAWAFDGCHRDVVWSASELVGSRRRRDHVICKRGGFVSSCNGNVGADDVQPRVVASGE